MLAALLCNLPEEEVIGGGKVRDWFLWPERETRKDYERKAKKAKQPEIKKAIRILKGAPSYAPDFVEDALETAELYDRKPEKIEPIDWVRIDIMLAYYAYIEWKQNDDEEVAAILLLI